METLSKRDRTIQWLNKYQEDIAFQCIHCSEQLLFDGTRFQCTNNHSFDINRQGYFHLSKTSIQNQYSKELFESRRQGIVQLSLYQPLHEFLRQKIQNRFGNQPLSILDAGSGEGSHLHMLTNPLQQPVVAVGIDLSTAGIRLSTDYTGGLLPIIADLSQMPFQNQQFDVILSILSPSNYAEFTRVQKKAGLTLKVIPNESYLKEIRETMIALDYLEKTDFSNAEVIKNFEKYYQAVVFEELDYSISLTRKQWQEVLAMTPLTWNLSNEQFARLLGEVPEQLTISVTILMN